MKFLLDSCVAPIVRAALMEGGHDALWAGDWQQDPGDMAILQRAYEEKRILITLDKDFGEIAIIRKVPHSGIIRLVNLSVKQQPHLCLQIVSQYVEELQTAVIITVEIDRVRIRPAE